MKQATLILLLTIPFIVFGQSWKDSKVSWKDNAIKEYHWTLEEAEKKTVYNDSTQTVYLESNMELLDGLIYVYHDNDSAANSVAMKVFVVKGKRTGDWKAWYKNGQLKMEGSFKKGKEHGLHKEWRKNGKLKEEYYYYYGEIQETRSWDENGNLIKKED
tara:strand:+ start:348 stop:824 length:477 start_codon:yes stop_codon:yes gene_type:complete